MIVCGGALARPTAPRVIMTIMISHAARRRSIARGAARSQSWHSEFCINRKHQSETGDGFSTASLLGSARRLSVVQVKGRMHHPRASHPETTLPSLPFVNQLHAPEI
jgi:hypothetical protein